MANAFATGLSSQVEVLAGARATARAAREIGFLALGVTCHFCRAPSKLARALVFSASAGIGSATSRTSSAYVSFRKAGIAFPAKVKPGTVDAAAFRIRVIAVGNDRAATQRTWKVTCLAATATGPGTADIVNTL